MSVQPDELEQRLQQLGGEAPAWSFDAESFDPSDTRQVDEVAGHLLERFWGHDDPEAFRLLVDVTTPRLMAAATGIVSELSVAVDPESLVSAHMSRIFTDLRSRRPANHYFLAEAERAMRDDAHRLLSGDGTGAGTLGLALGLHEILRIPSALEGRDSEVYGFGASFLAMVQRCFHALKEFDRRLLLAREVEDLTYNQMAERLSIPPSEVGPMLRDARRRFSERLGQAFANWGAQGAEP